jgi:hypothetical protein
MFFVGTFSGALALTAAACGAFSGASSGGTDTPSADATVEGGGGVQQDGMSPAPDAPSITGGDAGTEAAALDADVDAGPCPKGMNLVLADDFSTDKTGSVWLKGDSTAKYADGTAIVDGGNLTLQRTGLNGIIYVQKTAFHALAQKNIDIGFHVDLGAAGTGTDFLQLNQDGNVVRFLTQAMAIDFETALSGNAPIVASTTVLRPSGMVPGRLRLDFTTQQFTLDLGGGSGNSSFAGVLSDTGNYTLILAAFADTQNGPYNQSVVFGDVVFCAN